MSLTWNCLKTSNGTCHLLQMFQSGRRSLPGFSWAILETGGGKQELHSEQPRWLKGRTARRGFASACGNGDQEEMMSTAVDKLLPFMFLFICFIPFNSLKKKKSSFFSNRSSYKVGFVKVLHLNGAKLVSRPSPSSVSPPHSCKLNVRGYSGSGYDS